MEFVKFPVIAIEKERLEAMYLQLEPARST
jgi:hypothetical protein